MKVMRLFAASAVSAALAASMAISASAATTYEDVVEAAEEAGVQATNVQELSNFLEKNSTYFTSDQYDEMIAKLEEVSDEYVAPLAEELFGKDPSELTEDEKVTIGKTWSSADRNAIVAELQALADKYGVEIDVEKINGDYVKEVSATITTSSGSNTTVVTTNPVAATGAEVENDVNTGVVACAGLALVVAVSGVVIVARKNKA